MERTIRIRQMEDGTTHVTDDIEGTDRSTTFENGERRDELAETVAHRLADLDKLLRKPAAPQPEASSGERENGVEQQRAPDVQNAAE